jgi:hypothetical protein
MIGATLFAGMERDAGGRVPATGSRRNSTRNPPSPGEPTVIPRSFPHGAISFGKEGEQMPRDMNSAIPVLLGAMTNAERRGGVAYLRLDLLEAGQTFPASPIPIVVTRACYLAFVDPSPSANWGHDCRYLIIDVDTLAVGSHAARLPPFGARGERRWEPVYRAPGVLDAFVWSANDIRGEL